MRSVIVIVATLVIMLPSVLAGGPAMGVYFTFNPEQAVYYPEVGMSFDAYIYVHTWDCMLTAVEFALEWTDPPGIIYSGFDIPEGWLNLGEPLSGIAITWFPPASDYEETHLLVCTVHFFSTDTCNDMGGSIVDVPLLIVPHPEGGGGGGAAVIGTCWPDNAMFEFETRPGYICPEVIAVREASWGAIKDLIE